MKLVLSPKGYNWNQFELGATEVIMSGGKGRKIERRFPYWALSPSYTKREDRREKPSILWGKVATLSAIPLLLAYYALEVGWGLLLLGVPFLAIIVFMIVSYKRPRMHWITYYEDLDYQYAFDIPYIAAEEPAVLDFAQALAQRLEEFKGKRSDRRKEEDGEPEA